MGVNYRLADEDAPTATSLLEHMVEQDWADSCSQWDDVTRALGEGVVLNKFALLSKPRVMARSSTAWSGISDVAE